MKNIMKKNMVSTLVITLLFFSLFSLQGNADSKEAETKININTASSVELQKLPRIGEKVAQRIIDFRTKNGKFKRTEDIMKVSGIGESIFNQIKDQITVGTPAKGK